MLDQPDQLSWERSTPKLMAAIPTGSSNHHRRLRSTLSWALVSESLSLAAAKGESFLLPAALVPFSLSRAFTS
jgi:hypothetical protein